MLKTHFSLIVFVAIALIAQSQNVSAQVEKSKADVAVQAEKSKADESVTLKFDEAAEQEFTKGIGGDAAALERAMKASAKILANNPKDALALVWQGGGRLALARAAFYQGDFPAGSVIWKEGLDEMTKAVELAPHDVRVLLVRATTWYQASKQFPDPDEASRLLQTAVGDFEKIIALSDNDFKKLPAVRRDDILLFLAEGYERRGDKTKARNFYLRISNETTGKTRETAVKWLEANK